MDLSELTDILDAASHAWLSSITIPREYKTKETANRPIPENDTLRILRLAPCAIHTRITVDGNCYTIYATYNGPKIWINTDWNSSPPSAEGKIVLDSILRAAHRTRRDELDINKNQCKQ